MKVKKGNWVVLKEWQNSLGGMEIIKGRAIHKINGELLGVLAASVGPYGDSTGVFQSCKTTSPFNELGFEVT